MISRPIRADLRSVCDDCTRHRHLPHDRPTKSDRSCVDGLKRPVRGRDAARCRGSHAGCGAPDIERRLSARICCGIDGHVRHGCGGEHTVREHRWAGIELDSVEVYPSTPGLAGS
jgi:hypothetical protein